MCLNKTIVLITCCIICGCSDYASGYKDGYENTEENKWIVFGRSLYQDGFYAGRSEKFQQEWFDENMADMNLLQCPVVTIRADPLMFLPTEYKRVASDIYKLDFQ